MTTCLTIIGDTNMSKKIDLTGRIYERLHVLRPAHALYNGRWIVKCSCGNSEEFEVRTSSLTSGNTKSCGCLRSENSGRPRTLTNKKPLIPMAEFVGDLSYTARCEGEVISGLSILLTALHKHGIEVHNDHITVNGEKQGRFKNRLQALAYAIIRCVAVSDNKKPTVQR